MATFNVEEHAKNRGCKNSSRPTYDFGKNLKNSPSEASLKRYIFLKEFVKLKENFVGNSRP